MSEKYLVIEPVNLVMCDSGGTCVYGVDEDGNYLDDPDFILLDVGIIIDVISYVKAARVSESIYIYRIKVYSDIGYYSFDTLIDKYEHFIKI